MSNFNQKMDIELSGFIEPHFIREIENTVSSLTAGVWKSGEFLGRLDVGENYQFYDLASLTKVIFTTSALMVAVSRKQIELSTKISDVLSWYNRPQVSLYDVLAHQSGHTWWLPVHEELSKKNMMNSSPAEKNRFLQQTILNDPGHEYGRMVYSDVNYWLLGFVLQEIESAPMAEVWSRLLDRIGATDLHFCSGNHPSYERESYAPTEDCPWRKKVLQGEVHDDNAWALGGVASHAGLFGSLSGLSVWAQSLRQAYFNDQGFASQKTVKDFFKKTGNGDRALGFIVPSEPSSSGRFLHETSVGHLGFTGTSFWFDLEQDLQFIVLSNRVHPTRDENNFKKLRPRIHDALYEVAMNRGSCNA